MTGQGLPSKTKERGLREIRREGIEVIKKGFPRVTQSPTSIPIKVGGVIVDFNDLFEFSLEEVIFIEQDFGVF